MDKDYIVFSPTPGLSDGGNIFIRRMLVLLSEKYYVIGMEQASNDFKQIKRVKAVILNWTEHTLDSHTKNQLRLYKAFGIKICWFFHNRIPHECKGGIQIKSISWLANNSNYIFVLSQASKKYLPNYLINEKKCIFVPHINYIGDIQKIVEIYD